MKKRLTQSEEFEIMKLVLDKILWLGTALLGFGFYKLLVGDSEAILNGFLFMIGGSIILVLFMILIVKEYEIIK